MPTADGIAAALTAPLLEAVGFLEWESHWAASGGSAFALNMFKCNFASMLFLFMAIHSSNKPYIDYTNNFIEVVHDVFSPTAEQEKEIYQLENPINTGENILPMQYIENELDAEQIKAQEYIQKNLLTP